MPVTDYFRAIRAEVRQAVESALAAESVTMASIIELSEPDQSLTDYPAVVVWYGGSENYIGGTNARDDVGYPFLVGLFTVQPDKEDGGGEAPGCNPTMFREIMRQTFGNRRAVAVSGIDCYLCQYEPQAPVVDDASPALAQLRTVCGVSVYARVPRGS